MLYIDPFLGPFAFQNYDEQSFGGHIKDSSPYILCGTHCLNAASKNVAFFFHVAWSAILLSAFSLTSSLKNTSVLGCNFAQLLVIATGEVRRKGVNLANSGKTFPSSKNLENHLYLSSPGGYSISCAGICQALRPNKQVM